MTTFLQKVKLFLYGAFLFELETQLRKLKATYERTFMLLLYADMLGVPVITNYYSFRLLPYIINQLEPWKKEILKEFDILEAVSDIH
jgi:hypothetical protein